MLVPGAGGDGWYWHLVAPLLRERGYRAVTVDLPTSDEAAGWAQYADAIVAAAPIGPVTLVAQSMGGFSAPLAVDRLDVEAIVLVNAMVPLQGETGGDWWGAVGQPEAAAAAARRDNRPVEFDVWRDLFHDVPAEVTRQALDRGETRQANTPFGQPWPLDAWPDVATSGVAGADDRLFPVELQQRIAQERLGLTLDVIRGGHLLALGHSNALAEWLVLRARS